MFHEWDKLLRFDLFYQVDPRVRVYTGPTLRNASDYVNPLANLDHWAFGWCTCVELLLGPTLVYMVFYRSAMMRKYQYYILNLVVWNVLFDVTLFVVRPVFLFPHTCILFMPALPLDNTLCRLGFMVLCVCYTNMCMALCFTLAFRYAQTFDNWLNVLLSDGRMMAFYAVGGNIACVCGYMLEVKVGSEGGPDVMQQRFRDYVPEMLGAEQFLPVMCTPQKYKTVFFVGTLALIVFTGALIIILLWFTLLTRVQSFRRAPSTVVSTLKLQIMLFKAMSIQMFFDLAFCGFPTLVLALSFALQLENGSMVASICLLIVGTHGAFDYLIIIAFITPYRRTVLGWLGCRPAQPLVEPTASLCKHCMSVGHAPEECTRVREATRNALSRREPETQYATAVPISPETTAAAGMASIPETLEPTTTRMHGRVESPEDVGRHITSSLTT